MLVHEVFQIPRELLERERSAATRRFALATRIDGDNAVFLREVIKLMPEAAAIFAIAVQKNQRIAFALLAIVKLDIHKPTP